MCPLRLVLVFLSAFLAGFFAWKSIRSPSPSSPSEYAPASHTSTADSKKGVRKVIGDGIWVFLDMASGRYLWRLMKGTSE